MDVYGLIYYFSAFCYVSARGCQIMRYLCFVSYRALIHLRMFSPMVYLNVKFLVVCLRYFFSIHKLHPFFSLSSISTLKKIPFHSRFRQEIIFLLSGKVNTFLFELKQVIVLYHGFYLSHSLT